MEKLANSISAMDKSGNCKMVMKKAENYKLVMKKSENSKMVIKKSGNFKMTSNLQPYIELKMNNSYIAQVINNTSQQVQNQGSKSYYLPLLSDSH